MPRLLAFLLSSLIPVAAFAQYRPVAPTQTGERLVAIVPVVNDERSRAAKPMFSDLPGLISYKAILSDDGRWALIEVVTKSRKALEPALNSRDFADAARLRVGLPFDVNPRIELPEGRGVAQLLVDFQKLKRGFRPEHFGVGGR